MKQGFNINCINCVWCKRGKDRANKTVYYCHRPRIIHHIDQNIDCLGFEENPPIYDDY